MEAPKSAASAICHEHHAQPKPSTLVISDWMASAKAGVCLSRFADCSIVMETRGAPIRTRHMGQMSISGMSAVRSSETADAAHSRNAAGVMRGGR